MSMAACCFKEKTKTLTASPELMLLLLSSHTLKYSSRGSAPHQQHASSLLDLTLILPSSCFLFLLLFIILTLA